MSAAVPDRIEKQIVLRAPLARVWRAITDSREFGRWFGVVFDAPFAAGARMSGTIRPTEFDAEVAEHQKPYDGIKFDIIVDRIEPQTLFSFRWNPNGVDMAVDYSKEPTTLVVFELEEVADGVKLTITESGFHDIPLDRRVKAFTANEEGWKMQARLIGNYLAQTA